MERAALALRAPVASPNAPAADVAACVVAVCVAAMGVVVARVVAACAVAARVARAPQNRATPFRRWGGLARGRQIWPGSVRPKASGGVFGSKKGPTGGTC